MKKYILITLLICANILSANEFKDIIGTWKIDQNNSLKNFEDKQQNSIKNELQKMSNVKVLWAKDSFTMVFKQGDQEQKMSFKIKNIEEKKDAIYVEVIHKPHVQESMTYKIHTSNKKGYNFEVVQAPNDPMNKFVWEKE